MKKLISDLLEQMQGQEISSISYEEIVMVEGNKVYGAGKVLKDTLNTEKKIRKLFREMFENEFGGYNWRADFEEEFAEELKQNKKGK